MLRAVGKLPPRRSFSRHRCIRARDLPLAILALFFLEISFLSDSGFDAIDAYPSVLDEPSEASGEEESSVQVTA